MKEKSNILIVSDMCGYGKVSAAVQMPILSYMGHDVFNLPTMLISNTFPYGKYAILECTSYIEEALQNGMSLAYISMLSPLVLSLPSNRRNLSLVIAESKLHWEQRYSLIPLWATMANSMAEPMRAPSAA